MSFERLKRLREFTLQPLLGLGLLVALLGACGPIEYVNQVSRKASSEVEAARAVKADKHAPYYYTLAVEYLHKAREEAASADYQAANRFGRRAAEAARKARIQALERAKDPNKKALPELVPDDQDVEIIDPTSEEALADEDDNPLESEGDESDDESEEGDE